MSARVTVALAWGLALASLSACNALVSFDQPVESGAQCNDGVDNDGNGQMDCAEASCQASCSLCGNGRPDPGELCDDGNQDETDGCLSTCQVICGPIAAADRRGLDPVTGHCYLGFAASLDVIAANQACGALHGYLAVPEDPNEDGLVRSVAPASASLGLADMELGLGYNFRMVTGDRGAEYLHFTPGQPDAPLDQAICVSYDGTAGTWQDNDCVTPRPYVCELEPQPCGDEVRQPDEQCDDGNMLDADGCDAQCRDVDECALGVDNCSVDADCINQPWAPFTPGFACMCHGGFVGDGVTCTPVPQQPIFEARVPTPVSGTLLNCTTAAGHDGRKIALDPFGALYAVMLCNGDTYVMVSVDAGATWTQPAPLDPGVQEAAVVGVQPGRAVVAMMLSNGVVLVRQTVDFGTSWSSANVVGSGADVTAGLSLTTDGGNVLVGFVTAVGDLRVHRSQDPGLMNYTSIDTLSVTRGDLLVDPQNPSNVWAVGESPAFHLLQSTDGGVTFPTGEHLPAGQQTFSDWAIGGGTIFVTGAADQVSIIPLSAPDTSTAVTNLPTAAQGQRSITADPTGMVVIAQAGVTGGLDVVRLGAGAPMFDAPRSVDFLGTYPSIINVPNGLVAVVYRAGEQIRVAIIPP